MMKANRYRNTLFFLFFTLLVAAWGLSLLGVRPRSELERRAERVLPELIDVPDAAIRRVDIDRGDEHLVFERRGEGLGHWQMIEPKDVAAEPVRLDALVRNLKEMRKDPDAGTITKDPAGYGLDTPAATIRLYAGEDNSSASEEPFAELAVGMAKGSRRFVKPAGGAGIDVVDARMLSAVDQPLNDWRQPNLMAAPTFQVTHFAITRRDQEDGRLRAIRASRGESGQWTLELPIRAEAGTTGKKGPLEVPANGPKVESLLAALTSLRVAEAPKGYVADDVKDRAKYGLDSPAITAEVTVKTPFGETPMVLNIGKSVPDEPKRVYACQGDQDDVVMVESHTLTEIPTDAIALRSQQVADIAIAAVNEIEIDTQSDVFKLHKDGDLWEITSPKEVDADEASVSDFLGHIRDLQTSEFLDPKLVHDPMLDPPVMTIKIRQATRKSAAARGKSKSKATKEDAEDSKLVLDLRLGNHDVLKKSIYARLEGDSTILALPDKMLEVLPSNPLAFRDRTIGHESPRNIERLTIRRDDKIVELEREPQTGKPNAWRMVRPVKAAADMPTVTQVLAMLCGLRAQRFVAPTLAEAPENGLDHPLMAIDWQTEDGQAHWLKIASPPRSGVYVAATDLTPLIFTLSPEVVRAFDSEYHNHRVLGFPPDRVTRIVLHFFGRTLALKYRPPQARGQVEWVPIDPEADISGLDLSRIDALVQNLSKLQTTRFLQYKGEIPPVTGLLQPRLKVEIVQSEKDPVLVLRIGVDAGGGFVCATSTTGESREGATFLLPGPPWNELIRTGEKPPTLPDDVFAPAP